jgi:hypothetical protein
VCVAVGEIVAVAVHVALGVDSGNFGVFETLLISDSAGRSFEDWLEQADVITNRKRKINQ